MTIWKRPLRSIALGVGHRSYVGLCDKTIIRVEVQFTFGTMFEAIASKTFIQATRRHHVG